MKYIYLLKFAIWTGVTMWSTHEGANYITIGWAALALLNLAWYVIDSINEYVDKLKS